MVDTAQIEIIAAERDITRALHTYCRAIDRRDGELLSSVYHPGAVDDHGGAFCGTSDDYVTWVMDHLLNFVSSMHSLHNILIDVDVDSDAARAESYCIAHHVRAGDDLEQHGDGRVTGPHEVSMDAVRQLLVKRVSSSHQRLGD